MTNPVTYLVEFSRSPEAIIATFVEKDGDYRLPVSYVTLELLNHPELFERWALLCRDMLKTMLNGMGMDTKDLPELMSIPELITNLKGSSE